MIRVRQIDIKIEEDSIDLLLLKCAKKLKINVCDIISYNIIKKSIDARKKPNIYYVYEVNVLVNNEEYIISRVKSNDIFISPNLDYKFVVSGKKELNYRPIIVGSGPSGLFCAYMLAEGGYKPLIIERGDKIQDRVKEVDSFFKDNILNINSNVLFGEGGAGTFSDGKLNTLNKDKFNRQRKILEIFVENGADPEILYLNKPHIGTDLLRKVIVNIRNKIISLGGEFLFNTTLTNIKYDDCIKQIEVNNNKWIDTDILIMGIGHSARDTIEMLYNNKVNIVSKPFAVGVRVQHKQNMINYSQYGDKYKLLSPASYKLTYNTKNNRGVYTFCMCPGGYVINSSSEDNMICINGMSNHDRGSENANSAVIVTVNPNDFGSGSLDGIKFQRELERLAYKEGKGLIPVQLYKDFKDNKVSNSFGDIKPLFKGNYSFGNLNNIFPKYIRESLIEGIDNFNKKIDGFNSGDTILAGVESRTSSPVRIIRDDNFESNISGLYPIGEGAGYAGGIMSAAVDGIKIAEKIAQIYKN